MIKKQVKASRLIKNALDETNRRRQKQVQYNIANGITPQTIKKSISSTLKEMTETDFVKNEDSPQKIADIKNIDRLLREYKKKMQEAAQNLEFEQAMVYRDKIKELENMAIKNM